MSQSTPSICWIRRILRFVTPAEAKVGSRGLALALPALSKASLRQDLRMGNVDLFKMPFLATSKFHDILASFLRRFSSPQASLWAT